MNIFNRKPLATASFSGIAAALLSRFLPPAAKLAGCAAAAVAAVCLLFLKNKRSNTYITVFLSLLLTAAMLCASFIYFDVYTEDVLSLAGSAHGTEAEVISAKESYDGTRAELKIRSVDGKNLFCRAELEVNGKTDVSAGDVIKFNADFEEYNYGRQSGYGEYLRSRGYLLRLHTDDGSAIRVTGKAEGILSFFVKTKDAVCKVFDRYLPDDVSGLIKALLTGERSGLGAGLRSDFSYIGLPHILAISGMHFAVIFGLLSLLMKKCAVPLRIRCTVLIFCAAAFTALCGFPASLLRAGCMFMISEICVAANGRADSLTSLAFAVFLILLFDCKAVYDTGLMLSFAATLGIIVFLPLQEKMSSLPLLIRTVVSSVAVTLSAMLFTLPVVWLTFGTYSAAAIPANIVAAPLVGAVICLSPFILIFSGIPAAAVLFAAPVTYISRLLLMICRSLAKLRGMTVALNASHILPLAVITVICAVTVILLFKGGRKTIIISFLVFSITATLLGSLSHHRTAAALESAPEYAAHARFCSENGGLCVEIDGNENYKEITEILRMSKERYGFTETEVLKVRSVSENTVKRLENYCSEMKTFRIEAGGADSPRAESQLKSFCEEYHIELEYGAADGKNR